MKTLDIITAWLLVVGGLNWGLLGLFNFNLVATLFGGDNSAAVKLIYILAGIAALYQAFGLKSIQTRWNVNPTTN
mgnify:CR=1 FL=1